MADETDYDTPRGRRLGLLEGVTVLDLTGFLAGPFASMVLADLGADVIKIEPLSGDSTRNNAPHFFQGDSAYFLSINRNKRSIALNLGDPAGRTILHRLVAGADVIIDNLRAGKRAAVGAGYAELSAINPQIVSCSVTGFGSDGPYRDRPAYDIIVEALGGIMAVTGPIGGPSVRAGVPIGDITAGLYAAIGTLAGLESRRRTGRGTHIDVSMLDCQVGLLSYLAQYFFVGGVVPTHQGRAHVSIPTYNTFLCADDVEIVVAANTQGMWTSLCGVLGLAHLVDDPRFAANAERLRHRDELIPLLAAGFAALDSEAAYQALVAAGVPAAPINRMDDVFANPQVRHRDMVVTVEHRNGGAYRTLGQPIKAEAGDDGGEFRSPPALGGASTQILMDAGFSDDEIAKFADSGVVVLGG
jgi:CoA:oxalate CoA-transferase